MKRAAGFTLVEVLVAVALMLIIVATTLGTLTTAIHATEAVTLMADTQQNLRAGKSEILSGLLGRRFDGVKIEHFNFTILPALEHRRVIAKQLAPPPGLLLALCLRVGEPILINDRAHLLRWCARKWIRCKQR